MLFDCRHYLVKNVHNGALPVYEKYNRDMLVHVDGQIKQTVCIGNILVA